MHGTYEKKGLYWVIRYYSTVIENGKSRRIYRSKRLGLISDFPPKRHKGKNGKDVPNAIIDLGNQILAAQTRNGSGLALIRFRVFVKDTYLPYVKDQKKPSTYHDYDDIWNVHVKARAADVWLRDVTTSTVQAWLNDIAAKARTKDKLPLAHTTLARIKSFLSGAIKYALQTGQLSGVNLAQHTSVPKGRTSEETPVYELQDAQKVIAALKEPESTICAVAAYAGLRLGEILALHWEDYDGETLRIARNAYRGELLTPKTPSSQADVPVIPALKTKLDIWRLRTGDLRSGLMFPNENGDPLDPSNLDRSIRTCLKKAKLPWLRFHACRRGVATNLHDAGVNDLTIQRVLRHSDVSVTRKSYIKRLPAQAVNAMNVLQVNVEKAQREAERSVQ
jgi:integrase